METEAPQCDRMTATGLSWFMGSRSHPHRVLSVCVCVCVCVSRCLWVCVIPAFYSQFQPTSRSSDCLDLHQDDVQVVECSRGRIYQTQRPLRFGTHSPGPDPTRQFVVEVDASEVGVGAVLSQRATSDDKVHPCAFFSHRLSPAERNYDIGNRELLAVKLALEEWRHWLEGSGVPFIVWTDHKNLEYIQSANVLTPGRLVGHYFSDVLIFSSPIGRVLRTSNPMPCHAFLTFRTARCLPSALYLRDWLSLQSLGRSNRRSARPWKG